MIYYVLVKFKLRWISQGYVNTNSFQGLRLGNEVAKSAIEFIRRHIDPDTAATSGPLSEQIKSIQMFNSGRGLQ